MSGPTQKMIEWANKNKPTVFADLLPYIPVVGHQHYAPGICCELNYHPWKDSSNQALKDAAGMICLMKTPDDFIVRVYVPNDVPGNLPPNVSKPNPDYRFYCHGWGLRTYDTHTASGYTVMSNDVHLCLFDDQHSSTEVEPNQRLEATNPLLLADISRAANPLPLNRATALAQDPDNSGIYRDHWNIQRDDIVSFWGKSKLSGNPPYCGHTAIIMNPKFTIETVQGRYRFFLSPETTMSSKDGSKTLAMTTLKSVTATYTKLPTQGVHRLVPSQMIPPPPVMPLGWDLKVQQAFAVILIQEGSVPTWQPLTGWDTAVNTLALPDVHGLTLATDHGLAQGAQDSTSELPDEESRNAEISIESLATGPHRQQKSISHGSDPLPKGSALLGSPPVNKPQGPQPPQKQPPPGPPVKPPQDTNKPPPAPPNTNKPPVTQPPNTNKPPVIQPPNTNIPPVVPPVKPPTQDTTKPPPGPPVKPTPPAPVTQPPDNTKGPPAPTAPPAPVWVPPTAAQKQAARDKMNAMLAAVNTQTAQCTPTDPEHMDF